jgi:NADP-dependent 3-hydroxy acid dehydrogenase YdfG/acyl carrier protein
VPAGNADPAGVTAALASAGPAVLSVAGATVLVCPSGTSGPVPKAVHTTLAALVPQIRRLLAELDEAAGRLVVVTSGAVSVIAGEQPDLVAAPVWGLLRGFRAEYPDRLVLLDVEPGCTGADLGTAFGAAADGARPELAWRAGRLLTPRLRRAGTPSGLDPGFDPAGTVLVTGATGTLGRLVANHLVHRHGVRHLLLMSRSGPRAAGADALVAELTAAGATVRLIAGDAADPAQLAPAIAALPPANPLRAVVHAAGRLRDATVDSLTTEHLDEVLAPKVDAAWTLHDLTAGLPLSHFVLFSSMAGTLGNAGQANYAAANVFLDALAAHRHAAGLPATSIAWGLWAPDSGLTAHLGETERRRISRGGITPMTAEQGLALFDEAIATPGPAVAAVRLDRGALRVQARAGELPAILDGLVRPPARRAGESTGPALLQRLAALPAEEQERELLELLRATVAAVLGHPDASHIDERQAFKDLGFDSLTAVELRNRMARVTGIRLSATAVFDYPTPAALARYLRTALVLEPVATRPPVLAELDRLEAAMDSDTPAAEEVRTEVTSRLQTLLARWRGTGASGDVTEQLGAATAAEVFDFIDQTLGRSRG